MFSDCNDEFEVRVLTLKRWAIPHRKPLRELPRDKENQYGEYISFQNYHFIDIDEASSPEKESGLLGDILFSSAYGSLRRKRESQNFVVKNIEEKSIPNCDVSIRQSLTLIGRKTTFWNESPNLLFISMIHLKDAANSDPLEIEKNIKDILGSIGDQAALYFSLDYCDLVLFTRNISFSLLHEKLWKLLFQGKRIAKDSATIFCYRYEYLLSCLNDNPPPPLEHLMVSQELSLTIDLNVHSMSKLGALNDNLRRVCGKRKVKIFQIPGRYDVRIILKVQSPEQLLEVIRNLDTYSQKHTKEGFVSCEIVPITSPCLKRSLIAAQDNDDAILIDNPFSKILFNLYSVFCTYSEDLKLNGYPQLLRTAEVYRSIIALHENSFSEEFVLSILPSLVSFSDVCKDYADFCQSPSILEDEDQWRSISIRFSRLQNDFFNALNMLIQCTMHSERQFIQAPAVNLTLFDVPPKLLVFYSFIAYYVSQRLNDDEKSDYSFLIAPDFRDDIHVRPIAHGLVDNNVSSRSSNEILLINLDEESFYAPSVVIELICHEVAHHVGTQSRNRSIRSTYLFQALGHYVLLTQISFLQKYPKQAGILAEALGERLRIAYIAFSEEYFNTDQQFFLANISHFLIYCHAIRVFFADPIFKSSLCSDFASVLMGLKEKDNTFLVNLARSMDNWMNTQYLSMLLENRNYDAVCYSISSNIVTRIGNGIYEIFLQYERSLADDAEQLLNYCDDLLRAFSEAYADLRMIELLDLTVPEYKEIAKRYLDHSGTSDLQKSLRFNAVLFSGVFKDVKASDCRAFPQYYDMSFQYITEYATSAIAKYLSVCHQDPIKADELLIAYREKINSSNAFIQIKTIYDASLNYRNSLLKKFQDLIN